MKQECQPLCVMFSVKAVRIYSNSLLSFIVDKITDGGTPALSLSCYIWPFKFVTQYCSVHSYYRVLEICLLVVWHFTWHTIRSYQWRKLWSDHVKWQQCQYKNMAHRQVSQQKMIYQLSCLCNAVHLNNDKKFLSVQGHATKKHNILIS